MPSLNHVHIYRRYSKLLYMCGHPHCTHRIEKKVLVGKASLCNDCGTEFILNSEDLKRAKPKCIRCSNTAESRRFKAAKNVMETLLPSAENDSTISEV